MAQRKKKRTSIRTAAATVQKQYLARIRALRDDPLRVLPDTTPAGGDPKPIAKVRKGLEGLAKRGKGGFFDKRDTGVVGAVANILDVADQEAVPRLIDHKVAGQRRFYLQRGHVTRACSLGVQNHDDPRALVMAYEPMAKEHELHFFASPGLWCTGTTPKPPQEWIDHIAEKSELTWEPVPDGEAAGYQCGHTDRAAMVLMLRDGPAFSVCGPCGKKAGHMHALIGSRYLGPRRRQPLRLRARMPDGSLMELERETAAKYRGAVLSEEKVLREAVAAWRRSTRDSGGRRFVLGDRDLGDDQDAFLDALAPEPWERLALAAMTQEGHISRHTTLGGVLAALDGDLPVGVAAILGDDSTSFLEAEHRKGRDLLRAARDERARRDAVADLPATESLGGLEKVGAWLDGMVRHQRVHGDAATLARLRNETDPALRGHAAGLLLVLGDDPSNHSVFSGDDVEAGLARRDLVKAVTTATGGEYPLALAAYLKETGTGETIGVS